mgnify:CR=1 FL=1
MNVITHACNYENARKICIFILLNRVHFRPNMQSRLERQVVLWHPRSQLGRLKARIYATVFKRVSLPARAAERVTAKVTPRTTVANTYTCERCLLLNYQCNCTSTRSRVHRLRRLYRQTRERLSFQHDHLRFLRRCHHPTVAKKC